MAHGLERLSSRLRLFAFTEEIFRLFDVKASLYRQLKLMNLLAAKTHFPSYSNASLQLPRRQRFGEVVVDQSRQEQSLESRIGLICRDQNGRVPQPKVFFKVSQADIQPHVSQIEIGNDYVWWLTMAVIQAIGNHLRGGVNRNDSARNGAEQRFVQLSICLLVIYQQHSKHPSPGFATECDAVVNYKFLGHACISSEKGQVATRFITVAI